MELEGFDSCYWLIWGGGGSGLLQLAFRSYRVNIQYCIAFLSEREIAIGWYYAQYVAPPLAATVESIQDRRLLTAA
jgi:hypothetical protein